MPRCQYREITTYAIAGIKTAYDSNNAWQVTGNNNRNNSRAVAPVSDLSDQMNFQYPAK